MASKPAAPRGILPEPIQERGAPLPTVELLGLSKVPRGWVVVAVTMQGEKVIDREVLSRDPEPKPLAATRLMSEVVKAFVAPKGGKQ